MPSEHSGYRRVITRTRLNTIMVATLGTAVMWYFDGPLPFLLGPLFACLLAAFARVQMSDLGALNNYMRTILGVAAGASITPQTVRLLPDMLSSLWVVPVFVAAIGATGYPLFRKLFKMDHATAWYSAMPGGLQDMLVFGEEAGGDPRMLSLIHATRILLIVSIMPIVLVTIWGTDLSQPPGQPANTVPMMELVIMAVAGWVGWKAAARLKLFGASILGPMILTAVLTLTGVISHRPPTEFILAAQFFIGITVGAHYTGITWQEVRTAISAGLVFGLSLALLSVVFIAIMHSLALAPLLDLTLAFLPGGQAEMVVLALIAGADLSFVVCHHLFRLILVILLAPVASRIFIKATSRC